jgi:hypothetical protein
MELLETIQNPWLYVQYDQYDFYTLAINTMALIIYFNAESFNHACKCLLIYNLFICRQYV